MTGFEIASLVSLISGAFIQNQAVQDAAARQQRAIQDSLIRQQNLQRQAEQAAMKKATEFNPDDRLDKQNVIEQQLTSEMLEPVKQNMAERVEAPSVQGDVSDDYSTARASSMAQQAKTAEALARIFGRIGSASQLRQNEAIGIGDSANEIGMLKNFSRGQHAADQVGIQAAGTPSGGAMLAGTILQGVGQTGLMGAFDGIGSSSNSVWSGSGLSPNAGGLGFKNTGSLGSKLNGGASSWMPQAKTGFGSWVPKSI
ncbi:hypothetical protein [Neopusillimonas maritima]|uniref:Internal virion protein n=1 Tax=Neopusillimonas maritima TaxID=2026239 RepID=A0ABX9MZM2_9BURK|nr:hypothetical protein [Neopusillimonas maritima]RII84354.1 hypothetical protein CJO09_03845 [Neopusillimonas maritima]